MADAVARAMTEQEHLVVQAGTGTGKSLAYLVPAFARVEKSERPVVIATATLALQAQLVDRDLPMLADAVEKKLARRPSYAIYKGRGNYACLQRVRDGVPDDQGELIQAQPTGPVGRSVLELREWAKKEASHGGDGDRDHAPSHQDRAWFQVAVSARECIGADKCPYGLECFAERAKTKAMSADVLVTNHTLLAIDALENFHILPDYDVVVIDEAHELAARVTASASAELSPGVVERAARRARAFCDEGEAEPLDEAGEALRMALAVAEPGRVEALAPALAEAVALVRDGARTAFSAFPEEIKDQPEREAARRQAKVLVDQIRDVAERIATISAYDVVWIAERERGGPELRVAPLSVAGLLRNGLFANRTAILTSATLTVGGDFDSTARSVGLRPVDLVPEGDKPAKKAPAEKVDGDVVEPLPWRALDVGSPFDYGKQAILYVARKLPPPGRGGISEKVLDELCALIEAAGGRTLGLFSSRRAAEEAAGAVRDKLGVTVLCQGEGQLPELQKAFVKEPETSLFGTLSLWQGLDVPGDTCQLVVIDRIPFPRPDDPLMSARQRSVDEAGGNGFMSVAATHAGLLLAQGVGRLIRRSSDRGVVAVLDPRLVTARYGNFLKGSLPPMWFTHDREIALGALRRLRDTAAT